MLLSRHLPERVNELKKGLFLGVFLTIILLLAACGKNDPYTDMSLKNLKDFITEKETGFVLFAYDEDDMEVNKEQVKKTLNKNDQESNYFNYRELVSNKQSQTFQTDVGTEQSRDSLGYYEKGVLMAEFEMPNKWNDEKMEDLKKFVDQIAE